MRTSSTVAILQPDKPATVRELQPETAAALVAFPYEYHP